MILEKHVKQSAEAKDYDINYTDWLTPIQDTVNTAVAAIDCLTAPVDAALVCDSIDVEPTYVKFWVSGGTPGKKYKLTSLVTTVGGRTDESELIFTIKEF
jgi:hypothetical protein